MVVKGPNTWPGNYAYFTRFFWAYENHIHHINSIICSIDQKTSQEFVEPQTISLPLRLAVASEALDHLIERRNAGNASVCECPQDVWEDEIQLMI